MSARGRDPTSSDYDGPQPIRRGDPVWVMNMTLDGVRRAGVYIKRWGMSTSWCIVELVDRWEEPVGPPQYAHVRVPRSDVRRRYQHYGVKFPSYYDWERQMLLRQARKRRASQARKRRAGA